MGRANCAIKSVLVVVAGGAALILSSCNPSTPPTKTLSTKTLKPATAIVVLPTMGAATQPIQLKKIQSNNIKLAVKIPKKKISKTLGTQQKPIAMAGNSGRYNPSARSKAQNIKTKKKRVSVSTTVTALNSLHQESDDNKVSRSTATLGISYKLNNELRASAAWPFFQQLNRGTKSSVGNMALGLSGKGYQFGSSTTFSPSIGVRLPTNVEDRDEKSYQGSANLEGAMSYQSSLFKLPITTTYSLAAEKNFHQFTRSAYGTANISHGTDHGLSLSTELSQLFTLTFSGAYNVGWTYQGSLRNTFSLSESVTYRANKIMSLSIGHSNGGDVLAADGQNRNVDFYDKNQSAVFGSLSVTY